MRNNIRLLTLLSLIIACSGFIDNDYEVKKGNIIFLRTVYKKTDTLYIFDTLSFQDYGSQFTHKVSLHTGENIYELNKIGEKSDTVFYIDKKNKFITDMIIDKYLKRDTNLHIRKYKDMLLKKIKLKGYRFRYELDQSTFIEGRLYEYKGLITYLAVNKLSQNRKVIVSETLTPLQIVFNSKKVFPHSKLEKKQVNQKLASLPRKLW